MADSWASSTGVAKSMRANRRRDTGPELLVRKILHARGLRYRVDYSPLGGRRRADIVFSRIRLAVFIDGCFWHGCPIHRTTPKTNAGYWEPKLARNWERDRETDEQLQASGWISLRFWEHEAPEIVADRIQAAVRERSR